MISRPPIITRLTHSFPTRRSSDLCTAGDATVREGDVISLDGATGHVVLGELALAAAEPPEELSTLLSWADRLRRGKMAVRANADTGPDAAAARRFGAEGIGLCRTEHIFLAEDRLPIVRRMHLAGPPDEETAALAVPRTAQQVAFTVLTADHGGAPG